MLHLLKVHLTCSPTCTNGILIGIGRALILCSILDIDRLILHHLLPHCLLAHLAEVYSDLVIHLQALSHLARRVEVIGSTRETHHHHKVSLLYPFATHFKVILRLQRHILGRILCWRTIGSGVDTKDRKVARVSRPLPIVRISAKLTDTARWCRYKADIRVLLLHKEIIPISLVKRRHIQSYASLQSSSMLQIPLLSHLTQIATTHIDQWILLPHLFQIFLQIVSSIYNLLHDRHIQPRIR
ncbi:Uncharacterised protein [Chlamydia trachomatis]|nr:Uncharacterised protein [Chlamydia trachomatis]